MICHCRAHGCPRLFGEFDAEKETELCPECRERYAAAMPDRLTDSAEWVSVRNGRMRRNLHAYGLGGAT